MPRGAGSVLRLIEELGRTSPAPYAIPIAALGSPMTEEAYQELIRAVIAETAAQGSAVIVAHAALIALEERNDVLRVLVTAPPNIRAQRVADDGGVELRQAAAARRSPRMPT